MPKSAVNKFNIREYTQAQLRLLMSIKFEGKSPEQVFEIMGDPQRITDWYLLAKAVKLHPPGPDGKVNFNVEFVFFGDVYEEILHWDVPRRYVYVATGQEFPIKDYVGEIIVEQTGPDSGVMHWSAYFDDIEGDYNQRILPLILPPIYEGSANLLASLIGGVSYDVQSNF